MNVYIILLIISVLSVFIVDYSGFIEEMESLLTKKLRSPLPLRIPKPFSCSLCLTWWISVIWLLVSGNFGWLTLLAAAGFSAATGTEYQVILTIEGIVRRMIGVVGTFFRL